MYYTIFGSGFSTHLPLGVDQANLVISSGPYRTRCHTDSILQSLKCCIGAHLPGVEVVKEPRGGGREDRAQINTCSSGAMDCWCCGELKI